MISIYLSWQVGMCMEVGESYDKCVWKMNVDLLEDVQKEKKWRLGV